MNKVVAGRLYPYLEFYTTLAHAGLSAEVIQLLLDSAAQQGRIKVEKRADATYIQFVLVEEE